MSIIAPFHSQCDRNWKKISTVFILHQGWLHNNTTCQMRQLHCSITFFLSFFYLFDVSWIKAYCRGENTQTRMKDMVEGDCYGFGSYRINVQSDADGSLKYNPFRLIFPLNPWQMHLQVAAETCHECLFWRLCSPLVLPRSSTCTPTTPLLISQEHSGGKAFHLLNKVEGCHNTGA